MNGHYVMSYGGGRYTSIGWYSSKALADAERDRLLKVGAWRGMPPKVVADNDKQTLSDLRGVISCAEVSR